MWVHNHIYCFGSKPCGLDALRKGERVEERRGEERRGDERRGVSSDEGKMCNLGKIPERGRKVMVSHRAVTPQVQYIFCVSTLTFIILFSLSSPPPYPHPPAKSSDAKLSHPHTLSSIPLLFLDTALHVPLSSQGSPSRSSS